MLSFSSVFYVRDREHNDNRKIHVRLIPSLFFLSFFPSFFFPPSLGAYLYTCMCPVLVPNSTQLHSKNRKEVGREFQCPLPPFSFSPNPVPEEREILGCTIHEGIEATKRKEKKTKSSELCDWGNVIIMRFSTGARPAQSSHSLSHAGSGRRSHEWCTGQMDAGNPRATWR